MRLRSRSLLPVAGALVGLLALAAQPAHADAFQNGSFELFNGTPNLNGSGFESLNVGSMRLQGWSVITNEIALFSNSNPFGNTPPPPRASDGTYYLDLTGQHDGYPYGGVSQTFDTVIGATYSVGFDESLSFDYPGGVGIEARINNTSAGIFTSPQPTSGTPYTRFSFSFTATGTLTKLDLIGNNSFPSANSNSLHIGLDNVTVAAIPEPAFYAMSSLLGLGGGGLLLRRRRARA